MDAAVPKPLATYCVCAVEFLVQQPEEFLWIGKVFRRLVLIFGCLAKRKSEVEFLQGRSTLGIG
ncbi:hypothetical protein D3C87_1693280 [compost metagenome]